MSRAHKLCGNPGHAVTHGDRQTLFRLRNTITNKPGMRCCLLLSPLQALLGCVATADAAGFLFHVQHCHKFQAMHLGGLQAAQGLHCVVSQTRQLSLLCVCDWLCDRFLSPSRYKPVSMGWFKFEASLCTSCSRTVLACTLLSVDVLLLTPSLPHDINIRQKN